MAKRAAAPATNATPKKAFRQFKQSEIEAGLRKANGYITIAAQLIGCDPSTIHRRIKDSSALQQLVSDLTDRRLDTAELALDSAIGRGEGWAVCFFLKTMGKKRGYVERVEFVDWRAELEKSGVKASDLFEQMVLTISEKMPNE